MKYSVVVCDDEPLVCDLICGLVDWDALGFELVGTAHNGKAALELIEARKPDVVITDIRMPFLSGLDLVKETQKRGLPVEFIIVSGYRNFDYAYEAINYGVNKYLLKPVQKAQLESTLHTIKEEKKRGLMVENQMINYQAMLHKQFLEDIAKGRLRELPLYELNEQYQLLLQDGCFRIALMQFDEIYIKKDMNISLLSSVVRMAEKIAQEQISPFCRCCVAQRGTNQIIMLLNYRDQAGFNSSFYLKMHRKIKDILQVSNYFYVTTGLGQCVTSTGELETALETAQNALKTRLMGGYDQVLVYQTEERERKPEVLMSKERWHLFYNALEQLDETSLGEIVDEFFAVAERESAEDPVILYDSVEYLLRVFHEQAEKLGITNISSGMAAMERWSFAMSDRKQLELHIREYMCSGLREYKEQQEGVDAVPIEKAKKYIDTHIGAALSLDSVAAHVNLNSIYFSALFKKQTGVNFLAYVTGVRVGRAKTLLLETDYTVAEIAQRVGYYDVKYFSKIFKKETGINPKQYRKLHGG